MKKISEETLKKDIVDFANIVETDYLPKMRKDIDKSVMGHLEEELQVVKGILERRYEELQTAVANYLYEDFYIDN